METISNALRIIYDLIHKGDLENALWEINDLEQYIMQNAPILIEKYNLKTYFTKWRNRLIRSHNQNLNLLLVEIEHLAIKFENVVIN
ncbi:hypothetical protein ACHOLT_14305 [Desulfitobacterium sp. Sab5]|uniref:hypothetical protein n=1 Tax=Desulfitobacterium nosdiversum TaxID=3375356 RepID=UPI003CF0E552